MKALDLTGKRFGRLVVTSFSETRLYGGHKRRFWNCVCDCGSSIEVLGLSLPSGNTKSCGCFKDDKQLKHGMSNSPEYRIWAGMWQRCSNPDNDRYVDYGGRGITVCDRWQSFDLFYLDMGHRPSSEYSIDRIDNERGYAPSNCKWSTRSEQQNNKRPPRTQNLTRGADHWTQKDPERARRVGAENLKNNHGSLEQNANSKMTLLTARQMRDVFAAEPNLTMTELGQRFGVGRETARKIIRRSSW